MPSNTFCGYVAIVGRPNVGKSTLLNQLIEQKIAITSRRAQTTRHQILGIRTDNNIQIVFVDTPGIHQDQKQAMNRYMNKAAKGALDMADVILFIVDRDIWTEEDKIIATKLAKYKCPVMLVINKIDKLQDKMRLTIALEKFNTDKTFNSIIPVSAKQKLQIDKLLELINKQIPLGEHHFPEDQVTDRSERFIATELIREQIFRQLGDELPYDTTVVIEKFSYNQAKKPPILNIDALIYANRPGQKAILIGAKGERLKKIGSEARLFLEKQFETKVMLRLWVKIKSGWADNAISLKNFGYGLSE